MVESTQIDHQGPGPRRRRRFLRNPEGNSRLTAMTGALLFVILAVEGVTILQVGSLFTAHVFIGTLLLGPVLLKTISTTWRFFRYYAGDPAYVEKGPPQIILRLLGPLVVILSFAVIISGILLVGIAPQSMHDQLMFIHKATFVLWIGVTSIHVLGHILETAKVAPKDWRPSTRRLVKGASTRQILLLVSIGVGVLLALLVTPHARMNFFHEASSILSQ